MLKKLICLALCFIITVPACAKTNGDVEELMDSVRKEWWTLKEVYPELYGEGSGSWIGIIDDYILCGYNGSLAGRFTVGDLQYWIWTTDEYCEDLIDEITDVIGSEPATTPEDDYMWVYDKDKVVWLSMHEKPCQLWIGGTEHCKLDVTEIVASTEDSDGFSALFAKEGK